MNERSSGKDPASSPDGLAIFQAYTDLINSEWETLWARHNALIYPHPRGVERLATPVPLPGDK